MSDTNKSKEQMLGRVRRIKGQFEAIENHFPGNESEYDEILQLVASPRGH